MIPYYLTGILMYVNPTIQFLMGRFYFHEPLEIHRLIAFCFIWVGVGFTIWHNLKEIEKIERSRKHHIYKCRTGRRGKYFPAGSVFIYFDRVVRESVWFIYYVSSTLHPCALMQFPVHGSGKQG